MSEKTNATIYIVGAIILVAAVILIASAMTGIDTPKDPMTPPPLPPTPPGKISGQATNFAQAGTIVFNNPGFRIHTPYLAYEAPGQPALTKELIFDELSVCAALSGGTPCIAMSVTLDIPFNGKRAIVEGIKQGEQILVRKLYVVEEGQPELLPGPGRIFISWLQAKNFIEDCGVTMITQTHSLDVILTMTDGSTLVAVEPTIDEVFSVAQEVSSKCGNIPLATE